MPFPLDPVSLSAHHLWRGCVAVQSMSSSIGVETGGSLDSASSRLRPRHASVLRPSSSTIASSSLVSTGAHLSTSSTGLPYPFDSALVSRPPSSTSGLHSFGCALSLRPSDSFGLLLPSSSTPVLCRYGSDHDLPDLCLYPSRQSRLLVSASGSTTTSSGAVSRPPGVVSPSSTMTTPSVDSTVGCHHVCGLGPAWLLLFSPWLLPPSDPPWPCLSTPWLLPLRSPRWTLFAVLLPGVRPPPKPPPNSLLSLLLSLRHKAQCKQYKGIEGCYCAIKDVLTLYPAGQLFDKANQHITQLHLWRQRFESRAIDAVSMIIFKAGKDLFEMNAAKSDGFVPSVSPWPPALIGYPFLIPGLRFPFSLRSSSSYVEDGDDYNGHIKGAS
ncbi:SLIT and NTRK-like protein 4 [Labeo rohita]|uniref:SLIT and NTRK-like protein 4 n=1 Tax=Labeo rohita TaxID=84645 RepID=A0ABQ8MQ35_LABRO|nr:SLIT and NTRK-like protein 4 [Labeo rohita]